MRILQVIQKKQLRGAEVFACQLAQHLVDLGHDVKVVSLLDGDARLPFAGEVTVLHANVKKRFTDRQGWKRLAQVVKTFQPDVVQANAGDTLKYAILSRYFFGWNAPVLFRNASMVSSYIRSSLIRRFNGFLLKHVHHIASVSEASREDLVKTFPATAKKVTVIPIGIEERKYTRIDRDPGYSYLVHVGGFSFEKNHRGLLRIFAGVKQKHHAVKLWLIGDGPLRPETEAYAAELKLQDHVQFLGYRDNALDYIASADALLLPSIIEGLPGVVLEAFYTRTPAVANHVGGIGEVIENRKTGWLIAKDHETEFVDAVLRVLERPEEAKANAERAHALVTEKFTNTFLATRFAEVYKQMMKNKTP
ncbi:Glycosyltransferase involved in cell wall bisynthesis [Chryseolinea serpens]|uniref:Glycosyltransferase involved in cell wall bisynthesis n=1 Tax=Chryseolinea serpens TaxID=947013 RepID=A0A1M5KXG9_9BACT|nr:glycosyltransferase [Chryseolinea serpens]SHG57514.1 Glycosyltransferase involved in cell wall bisynthesis [Chryseolinea serpens]